MILKSNLIQHSNKRNKYNLFLCQNNQPIFLFYKTVVALKLIYIKHNRTTSTSIFSSFAYQIYKNYNPDFLLKYSKILDIIRVHYVIHIGRDVKIFKSSDLFKCMHDRNKNSVGVFFNSYCRKKPQVNIRYFRSLKLSINNLKIQSKGNNSSISI